MPAELAYLFLWSSGYIGAKFALPLAGTFTVLAFRYMIVVALVGLIVSYRGHWQRPTLHMLLVGFLGHFVWLVAVLLAFEYGMSAAGAALIAALQPAITAALSLWVVHEPVSKQQWVGIGAGFIGVAIFISGSTSTTDVALWVYLLPFIAALSLTAITFMERNYHTTHYDPVPVTTSLFWQSAITLVLLLPLAFFVEGFEAEWGFTFVWSVSWLAIIVSISAFALMLHIMRTRTSTRASSLQYFVPAITALLAFVVFEEPLTFRQAIGFSVTTVGFYLLARGTSERA